MFEWKTTWHPITVLVRNTDARSHDYTNIKDIFRPNHADLTYHLKYGIRDYRGGWRSSARETVSRVIAWAIAQQYLRETLSVEFFAYTKQVWHIVGEKVDLDFIETNKLRAADPDVCDDMIALVETVAREWDSIWWILECVIKHVPAWLWEPVFDKIKSRLAGSMMSIWGFLWFEYGAWFGCAMLRWSEYNESFVQTDGKVHSLTNKYGWILWWISTWEDIVFRVALKPTSSILKKQQTVDIHGNPQEMQVVWRHDPCLVPRAVPMIEAMAAIDILDLWLLHNARNVK